MPTLPAFTRPASGPRFAADAVRTAATVSSKTCSPGFGVAGAPPSCAARPRSRKSGDATTKPHCARWVVRKVLWSRYPPNPCSNTMSGNLPFAEGTAR